MPAPTQRPKLTVPTDPRAAGLLAGPTTTPPPLLAVDRREQLVYLLTAACELEQGVLCQYLFALYHSDQLFACDALPLGRVTYEEFIASWPLRSGDPFTDRMNGLPKFVASRTLEEPLEWNATLLKGDVAGEVAKLKQQPVRFDRHHVVSQMYRSLALRSRTDWERNGRIVRWMREAFQLALVLLLLDILAWLFSIAQLSV